MRLSHKSFLNGMPEPVYRPAGTDHRKECCLPMIFLERIHLCVINTETEIDKVSRDELKKPLIERPGNLIYFETDTRLYGIVSSGDVYRSSGTDIPINKKFSFAARSETMRARRFFLAHSNIHELPALEDGRLIGEFQSADDELYLDRAVPLSRNGYAEGYFAGLKRTALVEPAAGHGFKRPYFEKMKAALDSYHAEYTVVTFEEMLEHFDAFSRYLVVDQPERRGALLALYLLYGTKFYHRIVTFYEFLEKLESSQVVDCEEVFRGFLSQGVSTVVINARRQHSDYADRTEAAVRKRFPQEFPDDLNGRVWPFAEAFFDDLYSLDGYVDNILNGYFFVEQQNEQMRLRDSNSRYVNVSKGERRTVGQPVEYERTIYFYGPCLVIGSYEGDEYTIESWLQKRINECGYRVKVVNCGCWGGNVATLNRMVSTLFKKGDVIVALMEDLDIKFEGMKSVNIWETLEKNQVPAEWLLDSPFHVNHHVTKMYADEIFSVIFGEENSVGESGGEYVPFHFDFIERFFIRKYFHNVDLSAYRSAACCVFNGNPFTNGHRYLLEKAAEETEHVYLLVVKENSSIFSFCERYAMAVEAAKDLKNVTVIPSGLFIGNVANFPAYYAKMWTPDAEEQARNHVRTFGSVARSLHATHRFVGEEPMDPVTALINQASLEILPKYGIKTVIVPRKTKDAQPITGTFVRELAEKDPDRLCSFVPASTADIMLCETINVF